MLNKAVINIGAIRENATAVKNLLPKGVKLCCVVKADAYGHGAEVVSNALYGIADCFAVALVEEGIKLRLSGIDKQIIVLNKCFTDDIPFAVRYGLTLSVSSVSEISEIDEESKKQKTNTKVHIKFNSGMNRLGVDGIAELEQLLKYTADKTNVIIDGLYSHYANPDNENSRKIATDKFLLAISTVKHYNNNVICHVSASGGLLSGEIFDMVRVGILLYGYLPYKTDKIKVKPAMKIFAPVVKQRRIKKGESALYGEKPVEEETDVSIVRYGYADGLERRETDGQYNNRCMDLTAVKGNFSGFVNVIEDVEGLAEKYGTIPYEILTKSAIRAEKIYVDGD